MTEIIKFSLTSTSDLKYKLKFDQFSAHFVVLFLPLLMNKTCIPTLIISVYIQISVLHVMIYFATSNILDCT